MKIIIIPARMDSKRLPGKPLLEAGGKTLLRHMYDLAMKTSADKVYVATSDDKIYDFCGEHFINCRKTEECPSGTHRCIKTANILELEDNDTVVNLQCDEPFIDPSDIDLLFDRIEEDPDYIYTLTSYLNEIRRFDKNSTKVVIFINDVCHWFSRAPMAGVYYHMGVYAYSVGMLRMLNCPLSVLSQYEGLEQLTWIENGWSIKAVKVNHTYKPSINTQEDFDKFKRIVEDGS